MTRPDLTARPVPAAATGSAATGALTGPAGATVSAARAATTARAAETATAEPHRPASWFVVLADREPVVVPPGVRRVLRYASGRPWIVGNWSDDAVVSVGAGRSRLALLGFAATSPSQLLRLLLAARDVHALDVGRAVAGDYHVVAEIDGYRRVQGSATGTRRIFVGRLGGRVVAADRADVLAQWCGAALDRTALALCLLDPAPPHPLDDVVPWESIDAVAPDHYLVVRPDERSGVLRWWRRPAPVQTRAEGAPALRAALAEAVAVRVAAGRTVSCDLSGGLDSTAVCSLAARGAADVVAFTGLARDPANDDARWAARAAASLPSLTREILPAAELPVVYDGIAGVDDRLDRPFVGVVARAKLWAGLDRLALYGPRVHLTGFGGDEVAHGSPSYLPRLLRVRPWIALEHLRGYRAQAGWPPAACLRAMRSRGYRDCLAEMTAAIDELRRARRASDAAGRPGAGGRPGVGGRSGVGGRGWPTGRHGGHGRHGGRSAGRGPGRVGGAVPPALDWAFPPMIPGWFTADALDLVAEAFADAARRAWPLAPTRDGHGDLFAIRAGATVFRLFDQLAEPTGIPLAAPFLDERVVRAALAVRPEERTTPWEYKPLLKEAMRRIVPDGCLGRQTKADASAEQERGRRDNQAVLAKLCDDSPLAELGLVDPDVLREACRYTPVPDHRQQALPPTFAADAWLRVLTRRRD